MNSGRAPPCRTITNRWPDSPAMRLKIFNNEARAAIDAKALHVDAPPVADQCCQDVKQPQVAVSDR